MNSTITNMKEEKKTSKEILSELFDSFNATPPSSPSVHSLDDEQPSHNEESSKKKSSKKKKKEKSKKKRKKDKKSKKKHHDKKSKKKKKKKSRTGSSSSSSSTESDSDIEKVKTSKQKIKKEDRSDSDNSKKLSRNDTFGEILQNIKKEKVDRKVIMVKDSLLPSSSQNVVSVPSNSMKVKTELSCSKGDLLDSKVDSRLVKNVDGKSDDLNSVVLPDVVPESFKIEHSETDADGNKTTSLETENPPQVADIFVEELLESALASKGSSTSEKPKVNIKITDLKKINILELAEQKLKEKAEKYEEGEITSDSTEPEDQVLPSLRPVDSDTEEIALTTKDKEETKPKKSSRHKSHKSSQRKRSRSGSCGRKRSQSRDRVKLKRSRSRSRDKRSSSRSRLRKKRRSPSLDRKKDKKSHREKSPYRKRDRKEEKSDKKIDKEIKEEKKRRSPELRSKSRERRRNKSKSPLQLPSMIVQDNPNKKKRRSRSRGRGLEIDKKKLLEIARKNALSMLKQQGASIATVTDPAKVATTITAGGKTVDELTDFCKQLSQKEGRDDIELSPITESSDEENEKAFHHPFLIKDRPSNIVMNIRNCTALPIKTHQEKTAEAAQQLRLQFPVSSGQHHRRTESEWVPVEPKKEEPPPPPPKQTKGGHPRITAPVDSPKAIEPPPVPPQELISVFPTAEEPVNINIGDVVGQKLAAMKRLQDNPCDYAAMHLLRNAEDKLARWNESNQLQQPGLFTGSTGARLLTPAELASGQQAWAKKDQLMCAQPVTEGIGKSLLQKMGWKPGEGLGKNHEGTLEPLSLPLKMDKRGLVCAEEVKRPPRFVNNVPRNIRKPTVKSLEGKHPVSLLLEYCSKRHFNPPIFTVCFESGPAHKRMFLFKVEVNGISYQPPSPSNNKKQAKSEAAMICLRALGLMPSTTAPTAPT